MSIVRDRSVSFFFFSSRRRHTRCSRDWSSDVCSSDLKSQSTKALDDAVYDAAQLLKDRDPERKRRKIILLISDGENNPKLNTNKYEVVRRDLLRYDIAVYGVGVGSAFFNRRFERLSKYAHDSGGDVYYGLKSEDRKSTRLNSSHGYISYAGF